MPNLGIVLSLLIAIVILAALAARLRISYPILLVVGGLALGFVPGLPAIQLSPDLVFLIFLPPLLYAESAGSSYREYFANLGPIILLAVGLVVVTMFTVGMMAHLLIPGLALSAALVLGAIVGPTDEVAVAPLIERIGLPRRLIVILEAESLVNDGVSLVLFNVAVAAVVAASFSLVGASMQLLTSAVGGVLIGLIAGWLMLQVRRMVPGPAPVVTTISLLSGYAAYLPAQALHLSGVLAVVAFGLYVTAEVQQFTPAETRLQIEETWNVVTFLLNSVLFILVGLQLHRILTDLSSTSALTLVFYGLIVSAIVLVARIAWVFAASYAPWVVSAVLRSPKPPPDWKPLAIVSSVGIRGAISLAAALAVPLTTASGAPFPGRDLIIYLTFAVIFATLILQGSTLPALVRALRLREAIPPRQQEMRVRLQLTRAALDKLAQRAEVGDVAADVVDEVRSQFEKQFRHYTIIGPKGLEAKKEKLWSKKQLWRDILKDQGETLRAMRAQGTVPDDLARRIQRDLDLQEVRL
jgi:CPA1 family monovalent cation:H+ antiporter